MIAYPGMMRRFALGANAMPTAKDSMAVYEPMAKVRTFLGRLGGVENLPTMGFFEGFIQRFMSYLADLAQRQGSKEMEYTDCTASVISPTQELFRALSEEMALPPPQPGTDLF